jgi:hypothetical protein
MKMIFRKIKEFFGDAITSIRILWDESRRGGVDGTDMIDGGEHK